MHRMHAGLAIALLVASCAPSAEQRPAPTAPGASRQRPPAAFNCPANNLTTYTGVVTRYTRTVGKTTLRIHTDWDTTDDVTLDHAGTDDPSPRFQMNGAPFTAADWTRIEQRTGVLRDGTRAAAWVCSDGQVMVDWNVRQE